MTWLLLGVLLLIVIGLVWFAVSAISLGIYLDNLHHDE